MNFEYDEYYFSIDMISDYLFGGKAEDHIINAKDPARKSEPTPKSQTKNLTIGRSVFSCQNIVMNSR